MESNPAALALTLDWKNARQAVIQGKNVVRIPTLNVDKISSLNKTVDLKLNKLAGEGVQTGNKGKTSDAPSATTGNNANYYAQHPPEVFFIQDNNSTKLNAYLLNFVPTNPNEEFGKDSLWTGKLYEWNLRGDTVLVQDFEKSKLNEKFAFKAQDEEMSNSNGNKLDSKLNSTNISLKDKETSSFFGWLLNAVENLLGKIGSLFGISEHKDRYNEDGYYEHWRISIERILENDGNNNVNDNTGGIYVTAGFYVHYEYVPGIETPDGSGNNGSTNWDPLPNSGGGNSGPNNNPPYSAANNLIDKLMLTIAQANFLRANDGPNSISEALDNYLYENGGTPENIEFVEWAVGYLNENQTYTWNNFSDRFITNTAQYKLDSYIRNKYPKFSSIADGLVFFLGSNPKVVAALAKYSGFDKNKIMELATNGSGPNIKLSNEGWTTIANGKFNAKISDNTIFLAEENVAMFENTFLDGRAKYSLAFSLMVTILHETVHYGRFINGMPDPNSTYDFGTKFEELGFGFNVDFKLNQPVIYKMYYLP